MANVIKHKRGTSDPSPSDLVVGEIGIRTDVGKLFTKTDSGTVSEIAGGGSDIIINTLSSSSATGGGSATFNGSAYRFTLSQPPSVSAQQLLVSIAGVIQKPVAGSSQPSEGFSINGNDIILASAPATGTDFFILTFKSLGVSEPADNTVTSAKIVDGAIVNADVNASAAIAGTKISPDFGSQVIQTKASAVDTDMFKIIRQDSSSQALFSIFQDSSSGGGAGGCHLNTNNRHLIITAKGISSTTDSSGLYLKTSGELGIGTTSPSTKLDVIGNIRTSTNIYVGESIFHDGDNDTRLRFDTPDRLKIETAGVERVAFGGVTTFNETGADCNFRIEGDTDENLFFLDAGNNRVGIGTNNPNGKFVVASETSRTNSVEHLLIMTHTSSGTTTTGFGTGIRFQGERNNGALQTIGDINFEADVNSGTNISAALVFKPSTNGSPTEKMRLTSDGRLLLGTTTEGEATGDDLTIANSGDCGITIRSGTSSKAKLLFSDGTSGDAEYRGNIQYDHNGDYMKISTNALERMRIDSSGNVGINQVPTRELSLHSPNNNNALIHFTNDDTGETASDGILVGLDGNEEMIISHQESGKNIKILNGGSERMRIASNGKVGIGIDNPVGRLHLYEAGNDPYIYIQRGSGDTAATLGGIFWKNTTNSLGLIDVQSADINDGHMRFYTMGSGTLSERMRVQAGGGISFNGDTSANNALNDYEEGTFTPTSNATLTAAAGSYTKIGRQVTVHIRVKFASQASSTAVNIAGLPFSASMPSNLSNGAVPSGFGYISGSVINGGVQIHQQRNAAQMNFYVFGSAVSISTFSNRELRYGLVYHT